jgi:hypothetical protein
LASRSRLDATIRRETDLLSGTGGHVLKLGQFEG